MGRTRRRVPGPKGLVAAALALVLAACGQGSAEGTSGTGDVTANADRGTSESMTTLVEDFRDTHVAEGLACVGSMDLSYARCYTVDYLSDGSALVCVADGNRYLVLDRDASVPRGLDSDITVVSRPLTDVYLVASDTMCVFDALGAMDAISVSGLQRDAWHVEAAREAMDRGDIVFGGKYRSPDYELLLERGVQVAIESTMINHTPEVADKLRELGIAVVCELSSYEDEPLGRLEWMRLWGLMLGRDEEAATLMDEQVAKVEALEVTDTGTTVAFFYINGSGGAVVRRPGDYVCRMIEMAGGTYAFDDLEPARAGSSTVTLETERFFQEVADADVIVYNGSIDDVPAGVDDLVARCPVLADAKAVREGRVWATESDMYQRMSDTATIICDLNAIIAQTGGDLTYLHRLS